MLKPRTTRRLRLEALESRRVCAGNVGAWVTEGVLIIRGDAENNAIHINQIPLPPSSDPWPGAKYEIGTWKFNGRTDTSINGHETVVVEGVRNGFDIELNGGNDSLYISRTTVKPNGDRRAQMANVPGDIHLDTGTAADQVRLFLENNRTTNVQLGAHGDSFDPSNSLFRDLNLATDWTDGIAGNDRITLDLRARGDVNVMMGDGDDQILSGLRGLSLPRKYLNRVEGRVTIDTGSGNDSVSIGGPFLDGSTSPPTEVFPNVGAIDVLLGAGADALIVRGMDVLDDVFIDAGSGGDKVTVSALQAQGSFNFQGDTGDDSLRLGVDASHFSSGTIDGDADEDTLTNDSGTDLTSLNVQSFEHVS